MLIWIGKQLLAQTDKVEQNVETKQRWVVELPPAMTADQWVAAYGKVKGEIVASPESAPPGKASNGNAAPPAPAAVRTGPRKPGRPRSPNSILNRYPEYNQPETEEEEEIPER
jgi:hypothetical protein